MSHPVNLYATLWVLPELDFPHTVLGRRDSQDPDLAEHLRGFVGYITQGGGRAMSATLYGVIQHIQRVQNHISVQVDADALDAVSDWAERANALIFLSDGSVRDPAGVVLVDAGSGLAHPDARLPYPPDARERKSLSEQRLQALKVPFSATLPPSPGLGEVAVRSAEECAARALALLAVAVRAESLASAEPHGGAAPIPSQAILGRLEGAELSPSEQAFMDTDSPDPQAIIDHAWRYEALAVMLWAISAIPELGPATQICDVPLLAKTVFEAGAQGLMESARLRSDGEILDALDLHLRLHWAVRDAARSEQPTPHGLQAGVVFERHRALNWLSCFQDEVWDQVDTPT